VDGDSLSVMAAYTYSDFYFDGDAMYGDNDLPGIPKQVLRLDFTYRHPNGFYAGPNFELAPGSYYADNSNTLKVPSYTLMNFKLGFDSPSGWTAYVEGRNLADERYISTVAIAGVATPASQIFN